MTKLSFEQGGHYLFHSDITQTIDIGFTVINIGKNEHGVNFVSVQDCNDDFAIIESL